MTEQNKKIDVTGNPVDVLENFLSPEFKEEHKTELDRWREYCNEIVSVQPYDISDADAQFLMGLSSMPRDLALEILQKRLQQPDAPDLAALFIQFMALANSVAANCKSFAVDYLITECGIYPDTADKLNMPTIWGALNGVTLAREIDADKVCHTCAYRLGSCANQSAITTCDADHQVKMGMTFHCHEDLKPNGEPSKKCRGHLQHRKKENG